MVAPFGDEISGGTGCERPPAWVASERHLAWAYDTIADRYAEVWFGRPSTELAEAFLAHLPSGARILDAGCGPGQYTRHFWRRGRPAVGIDISHATVTGARTRCGLPLFARMSMHALGFRARSFAGVWACASVQHVPRPSVGRVLEEFHRVLEPDGFLFVNVPLGTGASVEFSAEFGAAGGYGRLFERYPDPAAFFDLLRSSGFEVVSSREETVHSEVLAREAPVPARWLNVIARKREEAVDAPG